MRECQQFSWGYHVRIQTELGAGERADDLILVHSPLSRSLAPRLQHPARYDHAALGVGMGLLTDLLAPILHHVDQIEHVGVAFRPVVRRGRLAFGRGFQVGEAVRQFTRRTYVQRADGLARCELAPRPVLNRCIWPEFVDHLDRRAQLVGVAIKPGHVGRPDVNTPLPHRLDDRHGDRRARAENHAVEEGPDGVDRRDGVEHELLVLSRRYDTPAALPVHDVYLVSATRDDVGRAERSRNAGESDTIFNEKPHRLA